MNYFYIQGDSYLESCSETVAFAWEMSLTQVIGWLEVGTMEGLSKTKWKIRLSKDSKVFTQM